MTIPYVIWLSAIISANVTYSVYLLNFTKFSIEFLHLLEAELIICKFWTTIFSNK